MADMIPIFSAEKAGALMLRGHAPLNALWVGNKPAVLFSRTDALIRDLQTIRSNADAARAMMRSPDSPSRNAA